MRADMDLALNGHLHHPFIPLQSPSQPDARMSIGFTDTPAHGGATVVNC